MSCQGVKLCGDVINGTFHCSMYCPCMIVMQSVLCNWVQETIYSEAWQAVAGHYTVMLTTVYQPPHTDRHIRSRIHSVPYMGTLTAFTWNIWPIAPLRVVSALWRAVWAGCCEDGRGLCMARQGPRVCILSYCGLHSQSSVPTSTQSQQWTHQHSHRDQEGCWQLTGIIITHILCCQHQTWHDMTFIIDIRQLICRRFISN